MSVVKLDGNAVGLPKNFIESVYKSAFEQSVVGRLAKQTPMVLGDNIIPISNGGFNVGVVGEGAAKPVSKPTFGAKTISPVKVAGIVIVSDEVARLNPANMLEDIQAQMQDGISRAIDSLVLHGRNPLDGAPLANGMFGITSATNGTTNNVELVDGDWKTAIYAAYDLAGVDSDPNGLALDTRTRSGINLTVQDVQYGLADLTAQTALVAGLPAAYGRTVGKSSGVATGVQAIIGDWSKLRYGFAESIEMKRSSEASIVDSEGVTHNLFQENKTAFLIEAKIGWGILDPSAFATIKDAE